MEMMLDNLSFDQAELQQDICRGFGHRRIMACGESIEGLPRTFWQSLAGMGDGSRHCDVPICRTRLDRSIFLSSVRSAKARGRSSASYDLPVTSAAIARASTLVTP
jgi:hypothetical protein